MSLETLVKLSRRYGVDPEYVIAGGGNTSFKDAQTLYIKGSGTALADVKAESFVRMDRKLLAAIWGKAYPADKDEREKAVLADLMHARYPGEGTKRPSVETLLHDILPFSLVVHTHPALVNGLTCSMEGEGAMACIFGQRALWIPSTNPGYILSLTVREAMKSHHEKTGKTPNLIFLQNHGVFVGADDEAGIEGIYQDLKSRLKERIQREPDLSGATNSWEPSNELGKELVKLASQKTTGIAVAFHRNAELARLTSSKEAFAPVSSAYTPDHIVYAGSTPLFVDDASELEEGWNRYVSTKGRLPKVVALRNIGIFGLGSSPKAAQLAVELFVDCAKLACYAASFGGGRFMTQDQIAFIENWEVEQYRSKVSIDDSNQ